MLSPRSTIGVALLALAWASILAAAVRQPGYMDAYYYYNAAERMVAGEGLTDPYLWTYINPPESLPTPSHSYWMPLQSAAAAVPMVLFGARFGAAQAASALAFVTLVMLAALTGQRLGGTSRIAWLAAALVLFSGFYTPFWTTTDTFALFGVTGAAGLLAVGRAVAQRSAPWFALSGVLAGVAHLTRADGLLLLFVLVAAALWPGSGAGARQRITWIGAGALAYLAIMLPWFVRNAVDLGMPLPAGGVGTIWLRGYDELVNYPFDVTAADFRAWGAANILSSRWEALRSNLATFVAVETWVILGPFVALGAWRRRRDPLVGVVVLYAVGLHAAMTLVFAYPGYRGGLFHSSSALLPFWAALGVLGLDASVEWAARRRRWPRRQAQQVFTAALVVFAVLLSGGVLLSRLSSWNANGSVYADLDHLLPADAIVMVNDPPAFYYHTGRMAVVVPNASPLVIPEIAARYGVTHVLLDADYTAPFAGLFSGAESYPFLEPLELSGTSAQDSANALRLFAVHTGSPTP